MKKLLAVILLTVLALSCVTIGASAASAYDWTDSLIGAMEIVNCVSYASLRELPDTSSYRITTVPLGAVVTNCYYYDDRFTYCVYEGYEGYILNSNLSFIAGPVGYEYPDENYLGNMEIVNCRTYASLRQYPDTSAVRLAQVPLGAIVTNCFYQDERFSYCMYGDMEGYILNDNLLAVTAGNAVYDPAYSDYLGDCVIVNCLSYASLRATPDTHAYRLAKVPFASIVTSCYVVSDTFAYCVYDGMEGYILLKNLEPLYR
ncbi:MAG: SH3 domain-containing protein [Clostridia bacterium]|nr:SH3 domain-containing protein [Clostridia bacterium]